MSDHLQTRRGFYIAAINLLGSLIAAAAAIPAAVYLLVRPKNDDSEGFAEVADLEQLKIGKPQEVLYNRKYVDGWQKVTQKTSAWLVRVDEHNVVAFNPACTHLACAYHWDDGQHEFVCPCHGSKFAIDGRVIAGPAPRPLDRYIAKIEDGKIRIGAQVEQG